MATAVYLLCAATSLGCAALLLRGYRKTGLRLLLWSGLCFVGLTLDNAILLLDRVVFPEVSYVGWPEFSFRLIRQLIALTGLTLLLYGLIWDSK